MTPLTPSASDAPLPGAEGHHVGDAAADTGEAAKGSAASPAPRKRRPKDIGTAAETAVVRHLQANGFPHAERRALRGTYDCGDITGTPGICWEVKGGQAAKTTSDGQIAAWLAETETERVNARADIGVLVVQRAGIGAGNAGRWWAVLPAGAVAALFRAPGIYNPGSGVPMRMHLADATALLRAAGYGDPFEVSA